VKKKILTAVIGAAVLAAAAAIPASSAFGQPPTTSRRCQVLEQQALALESQIAFLSENPNLTRTQRLFLQAAQAQLSLILAAEQAAHCPTDGQGPP